MKKETITKILGILFIIWFIASLVAMFIVAGNTNLTLTLLGQYFLIFSIVVLYTGKTPIISLHYFLGLILVSIGLIGFNIEKLSILLTDLSLNNKIFIGIIIITTISIIITLILYLREKKTNKLFYPFLISNIIYIIELLFLAFY